MEHTYYGRMDKNKPDKGIDHMVMSDYIEEIIQKKFVKLDKQVAELFKELRQLNRESFLPVSKKIQEMTKGYEYVKKQTALLTEKIEELQLIEKGRGK